MSTKELPARGRGVTGRAIQGVHIVHLMRNCGAIRTIAELHELDATVGIAAIEDGQLISDGQIGDSTM